MAERQRLTVDVTESFHRAVKRFCVDNKQSMTEFIVTTLKKELESHGERIEEMERTA